MRSGTGTKSGVPGAVTRATKAWIWRLAAPSFQDGSGSAGTGAGAGAGAAVAPTVAAAGAAGGDPCGASAVAGGGGFAQALVKSANSSPRAVETAGRRIRSR